MSDNIKLIQTGKKKLDFMIAIKRVINISFSPVAFVFVNGQLILCILLTRVTCRENFKPPSAECPYVIIEANISRSLDR